MSENRFTIFITIILGVLTILLAWNYYQDYNKSKKEEQEKTIFEKKLDTNKITRLIIYNPHSRIELKKVNEFWFVYPIDDIAYEYMVRDIISNIYQPAVSDTIDFDKNYYSQFFKDPIDIYLFYSGEIYHIQRGIKNDFTSETYLWIDLPRYREKIYVVNYWDFNYLDKTIEEFRMKKVLNIEQEKVDKIVVNGNIIYKEEVVKGDKKKKGENVEKVLYWKLGDGSFVSKEYINSLFGVLNNYDFKYSIDSYNSNFLDKLSKISDIRIHSQGKEYSVEIFPYKQEEYIIRCSYRKPLLVYSKTEINDFLNKELIEKRIFSYYIESFEDFDRIWISDSRAKFGFRKKENKWYSSKDEEKTSQINLLLDYLKDIKYKQRFLINPISTKYELYSFEFVGKGKRERFYLYNTDYLSYGREIYKIEPFVYILKDLLK
ncbi:MAG: hypothetical protein RMJ51_03935 [Candidatus Calescibacterium sp.]|nr:hypothetical protein [Candidatus Calescibacterium sp.]MCX7971769.1 hypothetical protein [bacterium]MDW8195375.1 hypothetical protein [Candidatus Calescibacterium sp.]